MCMCNSRPIGALRRAFAMALCLSVVALTSCKKKDGKLPVYPVKGQILIDGNPVKDVLIYFWPGKIEEGLHAYCPNAQTDENGYFALSTYDRADGAPEGEYAVTIEWPVGYSIVSNQWHGDHLQGKYKDQTSSEIKIKIEPKPNDLPPIRITAPPKKSP